jgi:hypothetical protein
MRKETRKRACDWRADQGRYTKRVEIANAEKKRGFHQKYFLTPKKWLTLPFMVIIVTILVGLMLISGSSCDG